MAWIMSEAYGYHAREWKFSAEKFVMANHQYVGWGPLLVMIYFQQREHVRLGPIIRRERPAATGRWRRR